VITAIVDEDQLSLAIGRNGQNVRLASQLIGWQIDLYGSREWLERGADMSLFGGGPDESMEMADFPLGELDLEAGTLAALEAAGYSTFLDIIDLERADLLNVSGLTEADADALLTLIDELTVVEVESNEAVATAVDAEASESVEDADASESGTADGEVAVEEASTVEAAAEDDVAADAESAEPDEAAGEVDETEERTV